MAINLPSPIVEASASVQRNFDALRNLFPLGRQYLTNDILDQLMPSGAILATARSTADTGYLLCDGASLLRADYPDLFDAIGTTYGAADGTHFNVPDLRGRVPVGVDGTAARLSANDALGNSSGAESVTLTSAQSGLPAHNHGYTLTQSHTVNNATDEASRGINSASAGGAVNKTVNNNVAADAASSHNNMQPYQIVNYQIKT